MFGQSKLFGRMHPGFHRGWVCVCDQQNFVRGVRFFPFKYLNYGPHLLCLIDGLDLEENLFKP